MEFFLETLCKPYRWAPSTALQWGLSRPQRAPTIRVEVRSPGNNYHKHHDGINRNNHQNFITRLAQQGPLVLSFVLSGRWRDANNMTIVSFKKYISLPRSRHTRHWCKDASKPRPRLSACPGRSPTSCRADPEPSSSIIMVIVMIMTCLDQPPASTSHLGS